MFRILSVFVKQRPVTCVLYMPDFIALNGNDTGREIKLHRTTTSSIFAMFVECKLIYVFEGDFPLSLNAVRS